jgi:hypothetical protein
LETGDAEDQGRRGVAISNLARSMLSGGVTFNVFTKLHDYDLLNQAIKNIPHNIHVRVWPKRPIDSTKLCRPCEVFLLPEIELTWVQCTRYMMHLGRVNNDEWVGHCHDDGHCTEQDIQILLAARAKVDKNCHRIGTYNPATPKMNSDVYVLYNTKKYWEIGGHDANFFLYWADIDFHIRQDIAGNKEHKVITPGITHVGSASMQACPVHNINFERDKAYFNQIHPNFKF